MTFEYAGEFRTDQFSNEGRVAAPADIAVGPEGDLFILDFVNGCVWRLSHEGELKTTLELGEDTRLSRPSTLAVSRDGEVYVADYVNHAVFRFNPQNELIDCWNAADGGHVDFVGVHAVAVSPEGIVYVTKLRRSSEDSVSFFSRQGFFLGELYSGGVWPERFECPDDVAVAGDGTVCVVDRFKGLIQRFTPDGAFLGQSRLPGAYTRYRVLNVAVSSQGEVFVACPDFDQILRYGSDGTYLGSFGSKGTGPGFFDGVRSVAVAPSGLVYVIDIYNRRIQYFEPVYTSDQ
ncbi:MAG TPA: NHL repeat-containing protein [bacterium]|nr:NHL repeat-containing protein [bacterium]